MTAQGQQGAPAQGNGFRLNQQLVKMEALYQAGLALASSLRAEDLTEQLLLLAVGMVDARGGFVLRREGAHRPLRLAGKANLEADAVGLLETRSLRDRLARAQHAGKPLVLGPADLPPGFPGQHVVVAPAGEVAFLGVVDKETRQGLRPFDELDVHLLEMMARQAGLALSNARLYDEAVAERNLNVSILESVANGVISTDLQGRIVRANPAALRILETEAGAARGRSCAALLRQRGCRRLAAAAAQTLADGVPREVSQEALADRRALVDGRVSPLVSADGRRGGLVVTVEDLTERARLEAMFKQYASDQVVEMLLRDGGAPSLGGQVGEATMLFLDTVGSTELLGRIGAEEMVALMNDCFTRLVEVVFRHQGTLDKYTGDGFLAVFGAPLAQADDTRRAVRCGLEIAAEMERFNRGRQHRLGIKMGLSRGPVVAGNIGSPRRMEYSVIGPDVNLASRLCDHAHAGQIVVSSRVRDELREEFAFVHLGRRIFKGVREPLDVYRVALPGEAAAGAPEGEEKEATPETGRLALDVPMQPEMEVVVGRVADVVAQFAGFAAEKRDEVKSALVEACINAFEHSRSKDQRLRVDFLMKPEELTVMVSDRGHGFDAAAAAERLRRRREAGDQRRGWGLELMAQFMDKVDIASGPEGTTLTLVKRR